MEIKIVITPPKEITITAQIATVDNEISISPVAISIKSFKKYAIDTKITLFNMTKIVKSNKDNLVPLVFE